MKRLTSYPSLEEAIYLHRRLIEIFGGAFGVRDLGLLESALARPRSGYYSTLVEQAGALLHSLAMNHCFVDGNKRVAFAMTDVFLRMNGFYLKISADQGEDFLINTVIKDRADLAKIVPWITKHMHKTTKE